jgi:hypothetical protein
MKGGVMDTNIQHYGECLECANLEKELADLKEKYEVLIKKYVDLKQAIVAYAISKKSLKSQDEFRKMVELIGYEVVDCSGIATIKEK